MKGGHRGVQLTFASYNIHKGVGLDGRRDPERVIAVLGAASLAQSWRLRCVRWLFPRVA